MTFCVQLSKGSSFLPFLNYSFGVRNLTLFVSNKAVNSTSVSKSHYFPLANMRLAAGSFAFDHLRSRFLVKDRYSFFLGKKVGGKVQKWQRSLAYEMQECRFI